MTAPTSAGARFRAALAHERPLQVVGTVNAFSALLREPGLAGKVVLEWTIATNGKVAAAKTAPRGLKNLTVGAAPVMKGAWAAAATLAISPSSSTSGGEWSKW